MQISTSCPDCGKEHHADAPEGQLQAWFTCECGAVFGEVVIAEPFAKAFLYGVEAFQRQRFSPAVTHFATAFEVCQKAVVALLLVAKGTPEELAHYLTYDLQLPQHKHRRLAENIARTKLPFPDRSLRNRAVHSGQTPSRKEVLEFGSNVAAAIEDWIGSLRPLVGRDFDRLSAAYGAAHRLPQDVSRYDRAVFDLETSHGLIRERWVAASDG